MRLTKWTIGMVFVVLALAVGFSSGIAAERHLGVVVNGHKLDVPVHLTNGRVIAPIRPVAEALGAKVHWRWGGGRLATPDRYLAVNGQVLDVPVRLVNDQFVAPIRPMAEALGAEVQWVPSEGVLRIDTAQSIPQSTPVVSAYEYQVWYDLPQKTVKVTAKEAVRIAYDEWNITFPIKRVILTTIERGKWLYGGGGPGPMERPIWLVFFKIPPGEYFHGSGGRPVPYGQDGWRGRFQLLRKMVRVDARTGESALEEGGSGIGPPGPYGTELQRVFRTIPPEEYQTFWNFPRFEGTFLPAQASPDEPQQRYSTEISRDGDRYRVSLTHKLGNEQTIWTFIVSKHGKVERQPLQKKKF